jgi:hypothetical protein
VHWKQIASRRRPRDRYCDDDKSTRGLILLVEHHTYSTVDELIVLNVNGNSEVAFGVYVDGPEMLTM